MPPTDPASTKPAPTDPAPTDPAPADPALAERLAVARALAAEAGALALRMRPDPAQPQATLKGRQDWLTEADRAVEALVAARLRDAFPEDGFLGEEEMANRPGARRWVVDPIDGTSNYARGGTRWCVSIGLVEGVTPLLGVIAAPALDEVFVGCRGAGAFRNGVPIRVAPTAALDRAIVECGWSPRRPNADWIALCDRVTAAGAAPRCTGSGALGLADVAAGRIDAYVELHINLWDVAAGLAILAEAGAAPNSYLARCALGGGGPIRAAAPGVDRALRNVVGGLPSN